MKSPTNPGGAGRQQLRKMRISQKTFRQDNQKKITYPYIRLCGPWLLQSGFSAGQCIHVLYAPGRIIITPGITGK